MGLASTFCRGSAVWAAILLGHSKQKGIGAFLFVCLFGCSLARPSIRWRALVVERLVRVEERGSPCFYSEVVPVKERVSVEERAFMQPD